MTHYANTPPNPPRYFPPLKGHCRFLNPPGHHPDAKDIVAVNHRGWPYRRRDALAHLFYRLPVSQTCSWGKTVYAPISGKVTRLENTAQDRLTLNLLRDLYTGLWLMPRKAGNTPADFLGNFLVIDNGNGVVALLAHLRQGSIQPALGAAVTAGQPLARVGNSGNTIAPHLHIHLQREAEWDQGRPIPFVLARYQHKGPHGWVTRYRQLPENYRLFSGD
ncbi:M23 family metallopeptidase [Oceanicoccus sagamiensis]|uniref:M23 family metallopeptidase n=1 Tax=Oceanicoccus sagamiensis TaxID=716816 RepID=UPI00146D0BA1|nr:M23 family metallopeptidase [Oceanicoccus sagamiensis]